MLMRKRLKWLLGIVLTPVIIFLSLLLLLYTPPIQRWAMRKAIDHISASTGMQAKLKHVSLAFPLDLQLDSLLLTRPNDSIVGKTDTVADVQRLVARVQLLPLTAGKVEVDELTFNKLKANTTNFIGDLRIRGDLDRLHLVSHNIDLGGDSLHINRADIRGGWVDVALGDTIPKDTTKKKSPWRIKIGKLSLNKTHFSLHMPGDSMRIKARFDAAMAQNTDLLLHDDTYKIGSFRWKGGTFAYDRPYQKAAQVGFDSNHMAMREVNIAIDSFTYVKPKISLMVRSASMKEKNGLTIEAFSGAFGYDATAIKLPKMHLKLPNTLLDGYLAMDLNAFDDRHPGKLRADLKGYVSKADLKPFLYAVPKRMYQVFPSGRLNLSGVIEGNMQQAAFRNLRLAMAGLFDLTGTGNVAHITGKQPFYSRFKLRGQAQNIAFVRALLPQNVAKTIQLPKGIGIDGRFVMSKDLYAGNTILTQGGGSVGANFAYNIRTDVYKASVKAHSFPLQHFLPRMGLNAFSGTLFARGKGTDVMNDGAMLDLSMSIDRFKYDKYVLDGFRGKISKQGKQLLANINSSNKMVGGRFTYRGLFTPNLIDGHIKGQLSRIDLHALGAMKEHYVVAGWTDADVRSNMKDHHFFSGKLRGFQLTEEGKRGKQLLLAGNVKATATMQGSHIDATVCGKVSDANLKALHIMDKAYHIHTDVDLSYTQEKGNRHRVRGTMQQFALTEHRTKTVIPLLKGGFTVDVAMHGEEVKGFLKGNLNSADLYQLGFVDKAMTTKGTLDLHFSTNGGDDLKVKGMLGNITVDEATKQYMPGDVVVDVVSTQRNLTAKVDGGDFHLNTSMEGGVQQLTKSFSAIAKTIGKQLESKYIDQTAILRLLPRGYIQLQTGRTNFFSELLANRGYQFAHADINMVSSPDNGLDGVIKIDSLVYDKVRMDQVNVEVKSTDGKMGYKAWIANNAANDYPYTAFLDGTLYEHGIKTHAAVLDTKGRVGIDVGLQVAMADQGLRFNITSTNAIIGYKPFKVNDANYIYLGRDQRVSANLDLLAKDGTGLKVVTDDEDTESLQNLTLSVHKLELGSIFKLLPLMPNVSGVMEGDYHIIQTPTQLSVSSDIAINNFVYEHNRMGDLGLQMVYMPKGENSHYVDATISKDELEVGTLKGTYESAGGGHLDAVLEMNKFPLHYVNGFVPNGIVGLRGEGNGSLSVQGALNRLDINGKVYAENAYLLSEPYGIEMRFGEQPLVVEHSKIALNDFKVYDKNNSALTMNGALDFSNTNKIMLDMQLNAQNFQLINAKENPHSEAYGKAFVDFMGKVEGPVDNLYLFGWLNILGSTNMTYIVKDQTLMSDTQLQDLVQFSNFKDTTAQVVRRPDITGFSMDLRLDIDEQARIKTILNATHTNYIDMIGGGALTLSYDPTNSVQLRGRYTLNSGEMKYTMEVIPLRTFNIQQGSYVDFTGDPMTPTLNIEATESVRASVSNGTGNGRLVDFNCGVKLTKQFPKPSIEFVIEAPEDQEMTNTLKTKSLEERSKLAVTMLASGLYFDGENMSSANTAMTGALASFLQTQVNSITGRALNSMGLDLSANMETAADINGALHTDYTFKFSKRLWNNRLRIILGGRVSTGSTLSRDNGAYFDNFSLEYRLNKNETKYLELYYEREAYDWLEGDLSEYGIGFLWRRKFNRFWDIFRFKKASLPAPKAVENDSIETAVK